MKTNKKWDIRRVKFVEYLRRKFSKSSDVEPIDFSSPSIPYYTELADVFSVAKMIFYIVLFVFLLSSIIFGSKLITYSNLYYLVKDINAAADASDAANYLGYPTSGAEQSYALYRDGLVIAGEDEITVISASGKQTLSDNVAYSSPVVCASDKYFVAFGRGERSFSVYNSFVRIYSEITDYPIYEAEISDSGTFAVVTRTREYKSEVNVYDTDMQKLTSYRTAGYVTSLALNDSGNRMVFATVEPLSDGNSTRLIFLEPGHKEAKAEITLEGVVVYKCGFVGNSRVAVVCSDRIAIYKFSGDIVSEEKFGEDTPVLFDLTDEYIGILFKSSAEDGKNIVKVFDRRGKFEYSSEITLGSQALRMRLSDTDACILSENELVRLSKGGKVKYYVLPDDEVESLLVRRNGDILACTTAYATVAKELPD